MIDTVAWAFFRTTLFTTLAAVTAELLLRRMRCRPPRLQRVASILVLLQGWAIMPLVLELPIEAPAPAEVHHRNPIAEAPLASTASSPQLDTSGTGRMAASRMADGSSVNWTAIVWAGGAIVVVLWFLWRYVSLLHHVPLGQRPTQEMWSREWRHVTGELDVGDRVQFRISKELGPLLCWVPFFYLVLCPELLWNVLAANQRKAVLQHELAHVKRRDLWKSIGIRVLALPQWFNPLAWMAVRAFEEAAEWACDDLVMTECGQAAGPSYSRALLQIADSRGASLPGAIAARGGVLSTRIRRLIEPSVKEERKMFRLLLPILLLGLVFVQSVRVETVTADMKQEPQAAVAPKEMLRNGSVDSGGSAMRTYHADGSEERKPAVDSNDTAVPEAKSSPKPLTGDPISADAGDGVDVPASVIKKIAGHIGVSYSKVRSCLHEQITHARAHAPPHGSDHARQFVKVYVVYDVADLVVPVGRPAFCKEGRLPPDNPRDDYKTLISLITAPVDPASWHKKGGLGYIEAYPNNRSLVVGQTTNGHHEITKLLETLRKLSANEAVLEAQYLQVPDRVALQCGLRGKQWAAVGADETKTLLEATRKAPRGRVFSGPIARFFNGQSIVMNSSLGDNTTGDHPLYFLQVFMDDARKKVYVTASTIGDHGKPRADGFKWEISNGQALLLKLEDKSSDAKENGVSVGHRYVLVTGRVAPRRHPR